MAQATLLIADRCRIQVAEVEAMDDEAFAEMLARARWLEERRIDAARAAILLAVAAIFRK